MLINEYQCLGYESLHGLVLNFASTHQIENPLGFSEVGNNKQLLIAIVGISVYLSIFCISIINRSEPSADLVFRYISELFLLPKIRSAAISP